MAGTAVRRGTHGRYACFTPKDAIALLQPITSKGLHHTFTICHHAKHELRSVTHTETKRHRRWIVTGSGSAWWLNTCRSQKKDCWWRRIQNMLTSAGNCAGFKRWMKLRNSLFMWNLVTMFPDLPRHKQYVYRRTFLYAFAHLWYNI